MPIAWLLTLLAKIPSLLTGINIPGLLSGASAFISGLLSNIRTNWKLWLAGLLVVLQISSGYGWWRDHNLLVAERAAHTADNAKFIAAQKVADTQAQTIKTQLQTEGKAAQHDADTHYSTLLAQYDASLVRYATHPGGPKQAGDNQLPATQGTDGPGQGTELPPTLTIPSEDAQICAENTARLMSAHDWAIAQLKVKE